MKRVVIVGSPGTGKTTFARMLSKKTGLPVVHLDYYYHDSSKDYYHDKDAWRARVLELMSADAWIMDGNYSSTMPERIKRADTVMFFDYSRNLAMYRVLKRRVQYRNKMREEMPADWKEKANPEFIKYVWNFKREYRPIRDEIRQLRNKQVYIFQNPRQAAKFLETL